MALDRMVLKMRQGMSLEDKIRFSKKRIQEWVEYWGEDGVYVSFSGGKDSTVLLHLVRSIYPNIKAMYVDTGLEYPEIKQFVKTFDNVDIIRPKMMFNKVIEKYGYPIVSKEVSEVIDGARKCIECNGEKYQYRLDKINGVHKDKNGNLSPYNCSKWKFLMDAPFKISNQCCNIMKKGPAHKYYKETGRKPIIATMTEESRLREQQYLKNGCNGFNNKIPTSTPIAYWTEQDILSYIKINNLKYASVYGDLLELEDKKLKFSGCQRTGCIYCCYGIQHDDTPNRFQRLQFTHNKQWVYCVENLGFGKVLDFMGIPYKNNENLIE